MSLTVVWTTPAREQLADLHDYISQDDPGAADGQLDLIVSNASHLADFPKLG